MRQRVLLVDDEPRLLDALRRTLRGRYELTTASSGAEGLSAVEAALAEGDPFAVIVSDMMMPLMNGAEFLGRAGVVAPDTVMMVLSGQADLDSTIDVVNRANLFRFLTKPCDPESLMRALDSALRQFELIHAERDLLQRTLGGTVGVLTDVLSMASPAASRRTARVRVMVAAIAEQLQMEDDWRLPIAAMLSHIGCIAVPGPVLEKFETGHELDASESDMVDRHPAQGEQLLVRIPRLEDVARWVGRQPTRLDAPVRPAGGVAEPASMVLEAVGNFLLHHDAGHSLHDTLRDLGDRCGYPETLVEAIRGAVATLEPRGVHREVTVAELRASMVLEVDVFTTGGQILVRRGEQITRTLSTRLANFAATVGVVEPIKVLVTDAL